MNNKGIVITLPEYQLSFDLLVIEKGLKALYKTQNFLQSHCCEILDESDEILNVKYQLIYTVGADIAVNGTELRWKTIQTVLQLVNEYSHQLIAEYSNSIEFNSSFSVDSLHRSTSEDRFEH